MSERLPQRSQQLMTTIEDMLVAAGFDQDDYPRLTGVDLSHPDSLLAPPSVGLHSVK
ncbi:hypothetical protein [Corynebacterium sp.]|uniref:hypothetical protein n=1 Tax=Corynebacterium sp. TaxID=1720 RepID=UPI00257B1733|nr:hypothetical protein [Corynebacterium sp.]